MLIVFKLNAALLGELRRLDPSLHGPELRDAIALQTVLAPPDGAPGFDERPLAEDRQLEELVRLYRDTPVRRRAGLLGVLRTMVSGLKG